MKRAWVRSFFFNIAFFAVTAVLSVLYLPGLLLPRKVFVGLVRFWLRIVTLLEYTILGLKYEVRGRENLPESGPYIIACKHQSAYETFKAHLLFDDPAIILKKELLRIPFFGAYLSKAGVLAIDRSTPERALRSIQNGALKIREQGRPLLIFPQGTRVRPDDTPLQKPYKPGVARVQEVTGLPVVPIALNSGVFWPRNAWLKSPGTVIFQIMKPIHPGRERHALMNEVESVIERQTGLLVAEARTLKHTKQSGARGFVILVFLVLTGFGAYTAWWGKVAQDLDRNYQAFRQMRADGAAAAPLKIEDFPAMHVVLPEETFRTDDGALKLSNVTIDGWPVPMVPITIHTEGLSVSSYRWLSPVTFDSLEGKIVINGSTVNVLESKLTKDVFEARSTGTVDISTDIPLVEMEISIKNHHMFLNYLAERGIIEERTAVFMAAGFNALAGTDGVVTVPISQRGRMLYAGPFAIAELPDTLPPPDAATGQSSPQSSPAAPEALPDPSR